MHILYDYAMSFVGKPYIWGGDDAVQGFDCSGLVIEILQAAGVLPRNYDTTAQGLYLRFKNSGRIVLSPDFGDLAFYGSYEKITHVGFCMDNHLMLEAGGGGSRTKTVQDAIDQNAYIRIRPIKSRKDLIALARIDYSKGLKTLG